MTNLAQLDTPSLVLDRGKVAANAAKLDAHLQSLGVPLRLHVKTAKSLDAIALVLGGRKAPITVSTLKEAEQFLAGGYTDILYAVGFTADKLPRAQALVAKGAKLTLIVDSVEAAEGIKGFPVLIEIDTDNHRAGVKPGDEAKLVAIAKALEKNGNTVAGVMTHAGESYNCKSVDAIRAMAEQERSGAVAAVKVLRKAGFAAPVVSVGSTPTATYAANLDGVTEVRAGVYVFQDLVMAGIDVCKPADIALSVLATVIGHQEEKGWILVDAGWMAMSRDRGTAKQRVDQGYGMVCDIDGRPIRDLVVTDANQEHGTIASRSGGKPPVLPIGTKLRILPNHACATGAAYPDYKVVDGSREVVATWSRFSGW
jgi:D-serine deaminase-like pyridoxal phosphate-dependent protein